VLAGTLASTLKYAVLGAAPPGGGVTGLLSKVIDTPIGAPVNDSETGALKLFIEFTEIYTCPEPPCMTLRVLGEKVRVKVSRSCAFAWK
jgi:hypothetical protein